MKKILLAFFLIFICSIHAQTLRSPNSNLSLSFTLNADGKPFYQLSYKGRAIIKPSALGIVLKDASSFDHNFVIAKSETKTVDESWNPVWGEVKTIRNNYNELRVTLSQKNISDRTLILTFRVFNDGIGFRYEFPSSRAFQYFIVADELTEFKMAGNHKAFWIPGDFDTNEYEYTTSTLNKINTTIGKYASELSAHAPISVSAVQTPLMMKTADSIYINIHEAALINYPAMNLILNKKTLTFRAALVDDPLGNKAYLQTPAKTPWRTIVVSDRAVDILASKLILNLNEPNAIGATDWINPQKYIGIWWEMHVDYGSWNFADTTNLKLKETDWDHLKPNGKHSANTERVKRYIDFAAEHGFPGVLVEGWDIGWEDWWGKWKEEVFDFVTPYPDFNVQELHSYAASKNVKLIMHHETSASVTNYERRMDEAYRFMKENGYDAVKTGYVGRIIPRGEHHDGQWMVNHYVHVAEKTAANKIMLDAHEPVRPTGLHRTYPNWLACEAARGNEYNAWSKGNVPEHETILPFTRLMGGPMDYTPGIFQIKLNYYHPNKKESVHTTLAKQLALYLTMYSPLQMAADLPESYERHLDAFQFIKDVAVDWDDSKYLLAEPGDYIAVARKAKGTEDWFLGAITDENARTLNVPLSFLDDNIDYIATIYADSPDADWDKNPMAYVISNRVVSSAATLKLSLAPGGGTAISFKKATQEDIENMK